MRSLSMLLRVLWAVVLTVGFWSIAATHLGSAHAANYESLMVPSAAMGRDIPVAFLGGARTRCTCSMRSTPARCQQLGDRRQRDEHAGRQGRFGGRARGRCLQHVHQLGAGRQQAVGDVPVQ
ncbi:MPT51/MPB51 antigen domain protein [Mycobacterium xenopi 3993]|nr:MPT51/MPB51 antigen domain protein [Mycobacterium xenopi 3993]